MESRGTILVVDDEQANLDSLDRIFAREGYRILLARSGEEAVETLRAQPVDVVLTDLMMPSMSGQELLRAVRAVAPDAEVVLMTAYGTVEAAVAAMKDGGDPGAVLFDAVARARGEGLDVVLCDTAGRFHTKANLMDELKRLKRTLAKAQESAPHEVLLVVDATTGQNAIQQARQFHDALGVTGFVLTKLDGTAKGGVIIGICDTLKIPVRYVGVGEKVADLKEFDAHEFVEALFGE